MERAQRVDTIDNLPPSRVRSVGPWTEQFSSNGRRYFYNRETEVSQWDKPAAWVDAEAIVGDGETNDGENNDDDRYSCMSIGRNSDRCGSSPEKIDVSDDENSPMEEEIDEAELKRREAEAERQAEQERAEQERAKEKEKHFGYRRYLDVEAMGKKYKEMFGVEKVVSTPSKENYPLHLSRRVEDLKFQVEFDVKMLEVSRARRKAEACDYEASFFERKAAAIAVLQKDLENRHKNFEANFDTCMAKLVAQAKIPLGMEIDTSESDVDNDDIEERIAKRKAKKAKRAWINWPEDSTKIVESHEELLSRRSEDYLEKRARFIEKYRPKEPTPSPSPEPAVSAPSTAPVILNARKLRELEVRSPSPSCVDDEMERYDVSPGYDDEDDQPGARSPGSPMRTDAGKSSHGYSTRSSSRTSSPDRSGSLLLGTEPFRTQEYTRPSSEQPIMSILQAPPPMPILDLAAIEKDRKKRRSGRDSSSPGHSSRSGGSPMRTDVKSPSYSPLPKSPPPPAAHLPKSPEPQQPQPQPPPQAPPPPQVQTPVHQPPPQQILNFQSPPMMMPMGAPPPPHPFNALDIPGFDPTRPPPAIPVGVVIPADRVILPPPPAPPILFKMNSPF